MYMYEHMWVYTHTCIYLSRPLELCRNPHALSFPCTSLAALGRGLLQGWGQQGLCVSWNAGALDEGIHSHNKVGYGWGLKDSSNDDICNLILKLLLYLFISSFIYKLEGQNGILFIYPPSL